MKKIIALALFFLCCACEKNGTEPVIQESYRFHDDYYTVAKEQYNLHTLYNEHFLIIKEKDKETVMSHLEAEEFQITTEPYKWIYYTSDEYDTADILSKCIAFTVSGHGKISSIPKVIYSNHLYRNDDGNIIGKTNTFLIKFTKNLRDIQLIKIKEYAEEHKFLILGDASSEYFRLACTDETSGNCVEMANWFLDVAGFKAAEPEFPEMTIDSDNQ